MGEFIPTLGSKNQKDASESFEYCSFKDSRKQNREQNKPDLQKPRNNTNDKLNVNQNVNVKNQMKKFSHDVLKLGMHGLEKAKAHKAKVALAISLGAKPEKNKKKNYKKLIEERKLEKRREAKLKKFSSGFSSSQLCQLMELQKKRKKHGDKGKRKKSDKGVLKEYGVITKNK